MTSSPKQSCQPPASPAPATDFPPSGQLVGDAELDALWAKWGYAGRPVPLEFVICYTAALLRALGAVPAGTSERPLPSLPKGLMDKNGMVWFDRLAMQIYVIRDRESALSLSPAEPAPFDFHWLVELRPAFEGHPYFQATYYAGWMEHPLDAAKTKDPLAAVRFARKEDAERVAKKLGHTLSCVWKAVEHGFAASQPPASPAPAVEVFLREMALGAYTAEEAQARARAVLQQQDGDAAPLQDAAGEWVVRALSLAAKCETAYERDVSYVGDDKARIEANFAKLVEARAALRAHLRTAAALAQQGGDAAPFARGSWQHAVDDHLVGYFRTSEEFATPHDAVQWLLDMVSKAAITSSPSAAVGEQEAKDAKRYRFLRDADRSDPVLPYDALLCYAGESLDKAIDAALRAAAQGGEK